MKKLLLLLLPMVLFMGCSANYSDGSRAGVIRKFSKKGVFMKSWEGELLLGGVVNSGGKDSQLVNETWEFSVDPKASHGEDINKVVADIQAAMKSGKRVELYYNQNTLPWVIRFDSSYCIYKVEAAN